MLEVISMNIHKQTMNILNDYFREMQHILYCRAPLKSKAKMLYGAKWRAEYYMELLLAAQKELQE
jgi:hypothetical protein